MQILFQQSNLFCYFFWQILYDISDYPNLWKQDCPILRQLEFYEKNLIVSFQLFFQENFDFYFAYFCVSCIKLCKTRDAAPLSIAVWASAIPCSILFTLSAAYNAYALFKTTTSRFASLLPLRIFFILSAFSEILPPRISPRVAFLNPSVCGFICLAITFVPITSNTFVVLLSAISSIPLSLETISTCR